MGTLVQSFIEQSEKRLAELQPAADEIKEIREALDALGHKVTTRKRGGGRRRRNGGRRQEFLAMVGENPGITVADAAKRLKINPNYLYRLAGDTVKDGATRKEGKGYVLAQSDAKADGNETGNGGKDE